MTLQASGAISMSQINTELGTNVNNIGHSWVRTLANKLAGTIKYSDLYSKSGHFTGNITISSSFQSVGLNATFFGAVTNTMLRNASNGNVEIDFNSAPLWQGNMTLINNTTGFSTTMVRQNSQSWQGANTGGNVIRASTADSFTFKPV